MPIAREEEEPGAANRGAPATLAPSGEAMGSGAGNGGGGGPEDIDEDEGNNLQPRIKGQPDTEADALNHGSR